MLLVIIFICMILLGFLFIRLEKMDYSRFNEFDAIGAVLVALGSAFLVISIAGIIVSHACANNVIQKNKIQYEGLCKRYEVVKSDYEDVSKSDVIADITEWNMKVYNTKYWTENPWTNWFNPKKISDNLEYISLEE